MRFKSVRVLQSLLAVVLAMVVIPTAVAGAKEAVASKGKASSKVAKQIKSLKAQTAALTHQVSSLKAALSALEGKPASGGAPSGPAGGDLTGTFPNPQLRAGTIVSGDIADGTIGGADLAQNSVTSFNIFDNTIGSADIGNGAVGPVDIAANSLGANQLAGVTLVQGFQNGVGNGDTGGSVANCPDGTQLIGGGANWNADRPGLQVTTSGPSLANPNGWEAGGENNSGFATTFFATALCLGQ